MQSRALCRPSLGDVALLPVSCIFPHGKESILAAGEAAHFRPLRVIRHDCRLSSVILGQEHVCNSSPFVYSQIIVLKVSAAWAPAAGFKALNIAYLLIS